MLDDSWGIFEVLSERLLCGEYRLEKYLPNKSIISCPLLADISSNRIQLCKSWNNFLCLKNVQNCVGFILTEFCVFFMKFEKSLSLIFLDLDRYFENVIKLAGNFVFL